MYVLLAHEKRICIFCSKYPLSLISKTGVYSSYVFLYFPSFCFGKMKELFPAHFSSSVSAKLPNEEEKPTHHRGNAGTACCNDKNQPETQVEESGQAGVD